MKKQNNINISPYLVAITGNIGVGKSLVGQMLTDEGYLVFDTDDIVKEILRTRNPVTKSIVNQFGKNVENSSSDYYINKKNLALIVFNNSDKRKELESIIHPEVEKCLQELFLSFKDEPFIFVLVPLLFECGLEKNYHESWCIVCDKEIQLQRLLYKGLSEEEISQRIKAQMSQEEKAVKANFIIDNSGSVEQTKSQLISKLQD